MKLIKKILFPLFSVFLFYRTLELLKQVKGTNPLDYSNTEIAVIAILLALFVTGIFAFIGFAYPTSRLLPETYYRIKNPKRLLQVCSFLGIRYFRTFLLVFFWGWQKNRRKYFNGTRSGIHNFLYHARQSEFGHLMAFVSLLLTGLLLLFYGHVLLFLLLTLINVIGNLYPVLLQRHHRIRINKVLNR